MIRIEVYGLEVNIIYECNLKCEYCTHMGKYLTGCVPKNDIVAWYETWHRKLCPKTLTILGGEPLLHPELDRILRETKRCWNFSDIQMVTNGMLLHTISDSLLETLKQTNILVSVSKHFDDAAFNKRFEQQLQPLKENGIRHEVRPSYSWWMKSYRKTEDGRILPYTSDPQKAWQNCFVKHRCLTLMDNRLYKCPQLACFSYAHQCGVLSKDWDALSTYEPLTGDATTSEMIDFLTSKQVLQCGICPEQFEYADHNEKRGSIDLQIK